MPGSMLVYFNASSHTGIGVQTKIIFNCMTTLPTIKCCISICWCRSGITSFWHDTHGRENTDIPLWKDPALVLNFDNFWQHQLQFVDYVVPSLTPDAISKYELGLSSCTRRIQNTRNPERAVEILETLQVSVCCCVLNCNTNQNISFSDASFLVFVWKKSLINEAKETRTYPFKWNRVIYKKPYVMRPEDLIPRGNEEELARVEELVKDTAAKRLEMETCVRIETQVG